MQASVIKYIKLAVLVVFFILMTPIRVIVDVHWHCSMLHMRLVRHIERWRRRHNTPPFRPRKRALTLPLPPWVPDLASSKVEQKTEDQSQSIFFTRFPRELREMVYKGVLCDFHHVHVHRERRSYRQGYFVCHRPHRSIQKGLRDDSSDDEEGMRRAPIKSKGWFGRRREERQVVPDIVPMLQSCRRVYDPLELPMVFQITVAYSPGDCRYSESINLLYSHNLFSFASIPTLIDFTASTLRRRLKAIRNIKLETSVFYFKELNSLLPDDLGFWTDTVWSCMSGLQEMRVVVSCNGCERLAYLDLRRCKEELTWQFGRLTMARMSFVDVECRRCRLPWDLPAERVPM